MRWPDQPGEVPRQPGPAPDRLAQRLAALPDGHPSAPDYATDSDLADHLADDAGDYLAHDDQVSAEPADGEPAGGGAAAPGHGPGDAAQRHPGGHPIISGRGEPYRPWFTAGEPAEPWFTAGPGGPPG